MNFLNTDWFGIDSGGTSPPEDGPYYPDVRIKYSGWDTDEDDDDADVAKLYDEEGDLTWQR